MARKPNIEEKVDTLLKRIDHLESKVILLEEENQSLKTEVNHLTKRLAKYENPKNSKNSSKPPSSDFPRQQKTQSLR